MDEERRARVDSVLEEALSMPGVDRATFLEGACGEDEELRSEVSSLVRCHERAVSFLTASSLRGQGGEPTFSSGEFVSERFQIVEMRARGGMGEVYEALDLQLEERVALKTIRAELAWDEKAVARFLREVHLARKVTHHNVCRIHDVFRESRKGSEDILFLTMELLPGENLASYLEREGRIEWREALPILTQILLGLEAAFSVGVLHRDLKAGNVMLVPEAEGVRAVVTDFGLAVVTDTDSGSSGPEELSKPWGASSRSAWGTPAYMSPEQLRGETVDHRSDIFSFGVIAYEMLSGENPYPIASETEPLGKRFESKPRSLRQFERRIPRDLDRLVLQSLEVAPIYRPTNASELRRKLGAIPTEIPPRRVAMLAAASAVGGAFVLVKAGPPVLEILGRWVGGPRVLPLEEYVDSPKALQALRAGLARVRDGANLEAIPYFEKAIADDANSILAHVELVETLLDVGERNRASEIQTRLDEIEGKQPRNAIETRLLRSVRARCNEDYSASLEELGVVAEGYPDDAHFLLRQARRLEESGRFVDVLPYYEAFAMDSFAALLGLGRALTMTGDPARAIDLLKSQPASVSSSQEASGMLHSVLGMAHYDRGEFQDAIRHWELSLDDRAKAGDRRGEAASLANLANAYSRVGRLGESDSFLDRALLLSREMGDRDYESYVIGRMGWLRLSRGDPRAALVLFREALAMESARKEHSLLAARLNAMAHAHAYLGFLDDALMNLSEAEKHIGPSGQKDQWAYNSSVKGMIASARGKYEESDGAFRQAIELYQEATMPHEVAEIQASLAETLCVRGEYRIAEQMLREGSGIFKRLKDERALARTEVHEASLAAAQGAFQDADSALARAEGRLNGTRYWETGVRAILVRGELSLARSRLGLAIEEFALAVETSVQSGFKGLEVLAQVRLGQALTSSGQLRDARMSLDEAVDTSKKLGFHPLRAMAAVAMSHLYFVSDDFESAVRTSADAVGIAKAMALKPILFRGCVALGDALFSLGRSQKAGVAYREAHQVHHSLLASMQPVHRQVYRDHPEIRKCLRRIATRLT